MAYLNRRLAGVTATAVAALLAGPAAATLIHSNSSNTIDGSLCVGFDCASNESMGFTTIKIEENNLRIGAADSSNTASFPTRDWQIEFNSSSNGGLSYFKIRDCGNGGMASNANSTCSGTSMFTIEAGADNDSIYVESSGNQGGNVGLGTTNPAVDLDILSGNTPTVRLQQDGSSGFAPQTWDVAGNEAGFFIRDATGGSTLPFRILPGVASNHFVIAGDEQVGIGAGTSPDAPLEVRSTGGNLGTGTSLVKLSNADGQAVLQLDPGDDGVFWNIDANVGNQVLAFTRSGTGATEMILTDAGTLTVTGNLVSGAGGSCSPPNPGCDAVFDRDAYTPPSIEEHAALMWENGHLPAVGPTSDAEPINLTEKTLRILNELEHAHIYIEELHERLEAQNARIEALERLIR